MEQSERILIFGSLLLLLLLKTATPCPQPPPLPLNSKLIEGRINCDDGFEYFGKDSVPTCSEKNEWTVGVCVKDISSPTSLQTTQSTVTKPSMTSIDEHTNCLTTTKESNPWIRIDLTTPIDVHFIKLKFGGETTMSDIELRVGNNSQSQKNPLCAWEGGAKNTTYKCSRVIKGQYVFIQMVGDGMLSICEHQVYSTSDPTRCTPPTPAGQISYHNNTCYELVLGQFDYNSSFNQCKSRGGNLLSIPYPQLYLKHYLDKSKDKLKKLLYFIGLERDGSFTSRQWVNVKDGLVVKNFHWGKDQPNNYNGLQNCIVLDGLREWNWNDVGCNIQANFICQFSPKYCGSPDRNSGSYYSVLDRYTVGDSVKYKCNEGWFIVGDDVRSCGDFGWSGHAPKCEYADCGPPENKQLKNGIQTNPNRTNYGAVIKYSCNADYTLVGTSERTCKETGKWSGDVPTCLVSTCPPPSPIINGTVSNKGLTPGSKTIYKCTKSSILIGNEVLTCQLGGEWTPQVPNCHYVQCGKLKNVKNGQIENGGNEIGDRRNVVCDDGYYYEGEDYVCTQSGDWIGGGRCSVITCPEPPVPLGSYIIGYELTINSIIHYHCEPGHVLKGQTARSCLNNGEWSGVEPSCQFIDCGRVQTVPYGQLQYTSGTHLNSVVKYSCASNYKLKGDKERKCTEDGKWSGTGPSCEEIRCPDPLIPPNSILSITLNDRSASRSLITSNTQSPSRQTYKLGSTLKYTCERGYKLEGSPIQTCIEGNWNNRGADPSCTFIDCGAPPSVNNGNYLLASNTTYLGSAAIYECDEGFKVKFDKVVCNEDGRWSKGGTSCDEITCPMLTNKNVHVTKYTPGGEAVYNCPRGFELIGESRRTCSMDGVWLSEEPFCRASPCPAPPVIPNSRLFMMNATLNNFINLQVEYTCSQGYEIVGNNVINCYEANWSPPPECVVQKSLSGILVGVLGGILVVVLVIAVLLYFKKRSFKNTRQEPVGKEHAMVMFEPGQSAAPVQQCHYYDNPTEEHIYEDIHARDSVVTINGVAI